MNKDSEEYKRAVESTAIWLFSTYEFAELGRTWLQLEEADKDVFREQAGKYLNYMADKGLAVLNNDQGLEYSPDTSTGSIYSMDDSKRAMAKANFRRIV